MKKFLALFMAIILSITLAACSGERDISGEGTNSTTALPENTSAANSDAAKGTTAAGTAVEWPEEFIAWNVPTIKTARVVSSNNTSMSGGVLVTGVNVIVNLKDVTKTDFESYREELIAQGYAANEDSLPEVMEVFEKPVTGGIIKITLSYTADSTTIIANNSAAAAAKDTTDGGKTQWPASAKAIPEFTKGTYVETVSMGGGMYAITFSGITDADLDWYRNTLKSAGFVSQENDDTEGYAKITANASYSVGFVKTGTKVQIIVASGTF